MKRMIQEELDILDSLMWDDEIEEWFNRISDSVLIKATTGISVDVADLEDSVKRTDGEYFTPVELMNAYTFVRKHSVPLNPIDWEQKFLELEIHSSAESDALIDLLVIKDKEIRHLEEELDLLYKTLERAYDVIHGCKIGSRI